jgi:3,4-dihydroxy-2-butanone 4-phosphate synthase
MLIHDFPLAAPAVPTVSSLEQPITNALDAMRAGMMRGSQIEHFAAAHAMPILAIADLVAWRTR